MLCNCYRSTWTIDHCRGVTLLQKKTVILSLRMPCLRRKETLNRYFITFTYIVVITLVADKILSISHVITIVDCFSVNDPLTNGASRSVNEKSVYSYGCCGCIFKSLRTGKRRTYRSFITRWGVNSAARYTVQTMWEGYFKRCARRATRLPFDCKSFLKR